MAARNNPCRHLTEEKVQMLSQEVAQEVYEKLKCRCCRKYCHPTLRQCILGHLVCVTCFNEKDPCKLCGSKNSSARPFILENIYLNLPFSCKYTDYDCKFYGQGKILVEHHKECVHFATRCPDVLCSWKGKPTHLFTHYRNYHPLRLVKDEPDYKLVTDVFPIEDCVYMPNIIMIFGRVFLVVIIVSLYHKHLDYIATNMEPFNAEEFNLAVDFELENGTKSSTNLCFVSSNNDMREEGMECHKINDFNVSIDNVLCDYTIRIEKKLN